MSALMHQINSGKGDVMKTLFGIIGIICFVVGIICFYHGESMMFLLYGILGSVHSGLYLLLAECDK